MGYLKSHHASKQEAQLQKVEQSALLLPKAEDIISISTSRFTHKTDQKINEIIYSAVHDSLSSLDLLNSQLFASS